MPAWMAAAVDQHNFFVGPAPARLFFTRASQWGIPFVVLHRYVGDAATMQVRIAGLFEIVNASGPEMTQAETVTLFNDICILAPAVLVDAPVRWQTVGDRQVKGTYTNAGKTISAVLSFDDAGDLVGFVSEDRYQSDGKTYKRLPWSTPLRSYRDFGGVRLAAEGDAYWREPDGEWPYGRFVLSGSRTTTAPPGEGGDVIVADYIAEELARAGVRHVFGVGGANIEDMFAAVQRRRPALQAVLGKHEHAAGTAADAYARISGGPGVVMVTSGGGAMNLVHALAEARASRVPLLAIVGEPPSDLQGRGAFQDTSGQGGAVDAAAGVPRRLRVLRAAGGAGPDRGAARGGARGCARRHPGAGGVADRQGPPARGAVRREPPAPCVRRDRSRPRATTPRSSRQRARSSAIRSSWWRATRSRAPARATSWPRSRVRWARASRWRLMRATCSTTAIRVSSASAGAMGHPAVDRRRVRGRRVPAGRHATARAGAARHRSRRRRQTVRVPGACAAVRVAAGRHSRRRRSARQPPSGSLPMIRARVPARPPSPTLPPPVGGLFALVRDPRGRRARASRRRRGRRRRRQHGRAGGASPAAAARRALAHRHGDGGHGLELRRRRGRRARAPAGAARCWPATARSSCTASTCTPPSSTRCRSPTSSSTTARTACAWCASGCCWARSPATTAFGPAHIGAGLAAMFPGLPASDCRHAGRGRGRARARGAHAGPAVVCAELPAVEVPPFVAFQQAAREARQPRKAVESASGAARGSRAWFAASSSTARRWAS